MDTSNLNEPDISPAPVEETKPSLARNPLVIVLAVAVLIVLVLAAIGWWSGGSRELSEEERLEYLDFLSSLEGAQPTEQERVDFLAQISAGASEDTMESRAEYLNAINKQQHDQIAN